MTYVTIFMLTLMKTMRCIMGCLLLVFIFLYMFIYDLPVIYGMLADPNFPIDDIFYSHYGKISFANQYIVNGSAAQWVMVMAVLSVIISIVISIKILKGRRDSRNIIINETDVLNIKQILRRAGFQPVVFGDAIVCRRLYYLIKLEKDVVVITVGKKMISKTHNMKYNDYVYNKILSIIDVHVSNNQHPI